jgi:putative SOS response-associated peptidase YedK
MCGRYALTDLKALRKADFLQLDLFPKELAPLYNIAPTQEAPVVLNAEPRKLQWARWGLIPSWAKDRTIGNRMINARAETVAEKPIFRRLFRRQRCLVPADGFYEWRRAAARKVPYHMALKTGAPFAFAGLWDTWQDPSTRAPIVTFTILTTNANALIKPIHDRMPVILKPGDESVWLSQDLNEAQALALIGAYPPSRMRIREVSTLVNSPRNRGPEVLQPAGRPVLVRKGRQPLAPGGDEAGSHRSLRRGVDRAVEHDGAE